MTDETYEELRQQVARLFAMSGGMPDDAPLYGDDLHSADVAIRVVIEALAQEARGTETSLYDPPYDNPVLLADWLRAHLPEVTP